MFPRLATAALLLASASALADPLIYAGRLERTELRPHGGGGCPQACPAAAPPLDGMERVCVSNSGGCQASQFSVSKVFAGKVEATRTIKAGIGEWGQTFPLSRELLLIVEEGGRTRWTYAIERDGQVWVRPGHLYSVPPREVWPIREKEAGLVPAEQVIAELRTAR